MSSIYFAYDDNGLTFFNSLKELIDYSSYGYSDRDAYILENPRLKMDNDEEVIITKEMIDDDTEDWLEIAREEAIHPYDLLIKLHSENNIQ
eukprot:SAG31_NODE_12891_length_908_cov_1.776267_1_plen_91_part_00